METTVKNKMIDSRTLTNFCSATDTVFEFLAEVKKHEFLKFNCEDLESKMEQIKKGLLNSDYFGSAKSKRLKRYFNRIDFEKINLKRINILLNCIGNLSSTEKLKISCPKHEQIQKLRKEWLKLERPTPESFEAYKKYIEAKGDFYKNLPDNTVL